MGDKDPKLVDNTMSESECERLKILLKEFPLAMEKYMNDKGVLVPNLKASVLNKPLPHICDNTDVSDSTVDDQLSNDTMMCGFGGSPQSNGDSWSIFSDIFCFSGGSSRYAPDDGDEIENANAVVIHAEKKQSFWRKKVIKKASSNILRLQLLDTTDRAAQNLHIAEESRRLLSLYVGLTREAGVSLDWIWRDTRKHVTVHTAALPNNPFHAMKADCILKASKEEIAAILTDDSRSKEFDETLDGVEFIERIDEKTMLRRYFYKPIWPTAARDFLMLTTWQEQPDGCILVSTTSPPNSYCPERKGYIRANIIVSGAYIRPIAARLGGGCAVTLVGHTELGGSIPASLLNMLLVSLPIKTMIALSEVLKSDQEKAAAAAGVKHS